MVATTTRHTERISISASADYLAWCHRLAVRSRQPLAVLLDRLLADHAAALDFEPPPHRSPDYQSPNL